MSASKSRPSSGENEIGSLPTAIRQPSSGVTRIGCCEPCEIDLAGDVRQGTLWNLSLLGCYVVFDGPLPEVDARLTVLFRLPGDPEPIAVAARVAWCNPPSLFKGCGAVCASQPPGCGLEFQVLSAADRERIEARVRATHPPGGGATRT